MVVRRERLADPLRRVERRVAALERPRIDSRPRLRLVRDTTQSFSHGGSNPQAVSYTRIAEEDPAGSWGMSLPATGVTLPWEGYYSVLAGANWHDSPVYGGVRFGRIYHFAIGGALKTVAEEGRSGATADSRVAAAAMIWGRIGEGVAFHLWHNANSETRTVQIGTDPTGAPIWGTQQVPGPLRTWGVTEGETVDLFLNHLVIVYQGA